MKSLFDALFGQQPPKKEPKPRKKPTPTEGGKKKSIRKSLLEKTVWEVQNQSISVEIHRELGRKSWRYSFAKNGKLLVRMPIFAHVENDIQLIDTIKKRLNEQVDKKPEMLDFFEKRVYKNGEILTVGNRQYTLNIELEDRAGHSGKIQRNHVVTLKIASADTEGGQQKAMSTLLSRLIGADYLPEFTRRVIELNHIFFKKNIKSVRFKQNHSNWGSCSSTGNLNFSTRLLFAPIDVQDYIIIHELAHLIEFNHSDRFWQLVEQAMPNYQEKEKWLKVNGRSCKW
jgi:predicted metal-dependent hydrolase